MANSLDQFLCDYNAKISETRKSDDQRFLIYSVKRHEVFSQSRLVGGLADRLKGIVASFCLATLTDRRFVIEWDTPFDLTHNFKPSQYDWLFSNARKFILQTMSVMHVDMIDRSELVDKLTPEKIESEVFGGANVVILNINSPRVQMFLNHFTENYNTDLAFNHLFTTVFKFLFNFVEKPTFAESRAAIREVREASDMLVGVHLRTGAGNGWKDPGLDDWQNYSKVLEYAFEHARESGAKDPSFYFISDSVEARNKVLAESWPHRVHCDLFTPTHMDRSGEADIEGNDLTYHEFQMLSSTDRIVSGQGGFAALAAQMGGKPFLRYV
ncbi:hypothetical protein [uncultured Litoreibacter sp.]|uniref:hypothetical protein n=1 Tax=uncultured Litoreibacter sp. TaxID=1392394 RepID=UPI0026267ED8|nr:hypothetical protein [uncultured Litoreibacter sp.]